MGPLSDIRQNNLPFIARLLTIQNKKYYMLKRHSMIQQFCFDDRKFGKGG
jgi:hypothetical protein